ncbi:MAG: hypothetical protein K2W95_10490 [Candidatus Obscuribacterales bacterium]|nr:hypothetical protein [Candidatus Obscuribacterales bacterium]
MGEGRSNVPGEIETPEIGIPAGTADNGVLLRDSGFLAPGSENEPVQGEPQAPLDGGQPSTPFRPGQEAAQVGDPPASNLPSPFRPARPEVGPAVNAPPDTPARPVENPPAPADSPTPVARVADRTATADRPGLVSQLPREALDANSRAMELLQAVRPGVPMSEDQRRGFEKALSDAGKIDPVKAAEQERQLEDDLKNRTRSVPGGKVLPPWTEQKERDFLGKVDATQKALSDIPESTRTRVLELERQLRALPNLDPRRAPLYVALNELSAPAADPGGKVRAYRAQKDQLDTFTKDNADGLARRQIHQQEMALLHSKSIVSGLYALALERTGTTSKDDTDKIKSLVRDSMGDKFATGNIPEIMLLREKYGVIERDPGDDKIPGRLALKRAVEIMNDQTQGTPKERLERAKPFFEQAVGASDEIDMKKIDEELQAIAKEANEIGEGNNPARMDELDKRATELLEKLKQPGLARLAYATAMNDVAVQTKDKDLNTRAINILKSLELRDPGAKYDPLVQGALLLASSDPPKSITEEEAVKVGLPEVERRKKEDTEAGKPPEIPFWRKAAGASVDFLVSMAAMYAISKLWKAGREGPVRAWQTSRRTNSVQMEATPSLRPGEAPRMVIQGADGVEREVSGVRKEDGRIRVKDGEKVEAVDLKKGDKLVLKVAPDSKLSPDQVREAARKILTPTRIEEAVQDLKTQHEAQLRQREIEIEQMRQALEQSRVGSGSPGTEAARPRVGDRVQHNNETHSVAGETGREAILHRPTTADAAVAEPVTEADLKAKYEEVKVTVDGKQETRYLEKGHAERGAFKVTEAAGQRFIAPDVSLTVVPAEQVRVAAPTVVAPGGQTTTSSGGTTSTPAREVPAPERPAPERGPAPTADRLQGTELRPGADGTLQRNETRVGETMSVDRLREQKEVSGEQIRGLETEIERLKKSDKAAERQRAAELEIAVKALKGEYGPTAKADAHRAIMEGTRTELEGRRFGRGATVVAAVGIGILATAALAWYLGSQRPKEVPLVRPSVSGK